MACLPEPENRQRSFAGRRRINEPRTQSKQTIHLMKSAAFRQPPLLAVLPFLPALSASAQYVGPSTSIDPYLIPSSSIPALDRRRVAVGCGNWTSPTFPTCPRAGSF